MKRFRISCIVVFLLCMLSQPSLAQYTIWHSPLTFSTDQAPLTIKRNSSAAAGVRVETSSAGDNRWVYLGLTMPSNVVVDSLILCYQLSSPTSFISEIRLSTMKTPDVSSTFFADQTDLAMVGPSCYATSLGGSVVKGATTLFLRLNFTSTADWIDIGAIGVVVSPNVTSVTERNETSAPVDFRLKQNYPNPFNPRTTIDYEVQKSASVRIDIFNSIGQRVRTLVNGVRPEGSYSIRWDGRDDNGVLLATGTYYYQMKTGSRTTAKKMLFLK